MKRALNLVPGILLLASPFIIAFGWNTVAPFLIIGGLLLSAVIAGGGYLLFLLNVARRFMQ